VREELAAARQKWVGLLMDGLWKIGWKLKCIKQTMYVPIACFAIVGHDQPSKYNFLATITRFLTLLCIKYKIALRDTTDPEPSLNALWDMIKAI